MLSLFNSVNSFFSDYGLLIILVVAFILLMLVTFSRRKKEEEYKNDLNTKIVPGAKVLTRAGLYGTVISVTETTDGKIVLIESGEGDKVSYHKMHIDAIYGLDTSSPIMYDAEGNVLTPEEAFDALNKKSSENVEKVEEKNTKEEVVEDKKEDEKEESTKTAETKETTKKAPAKKKTSSSSKSSTTKSKSKKVESTETK